MGKYCRSLSLGDLTVFVACRHCLSPHNMHHRGRWAHSDMSTLPTRLPKIWLQRKSKTSFPDLVQIEILHLSNYWLDCCDVLYRHSRSQRIKSLSYCSYKGLTLKNYSVGFHRICYRYSWFPGDESLWWSPDFSSSAILSNVSKSAEGIKAIFCTDIQASQMMNPNHEFDICSFEKPKCLNDYTHTHLNPAQDEL